MTQDPYKYFRIEARELVDQLGRGLLELEKGVDATELVPRLLRSAHTLKGAARVVRQVAIADHAHAIEDALAPFRTTGDGVPRGHIDTLLHMVDTIGEQVASLGTAGADTPVTPGKPAPPEAALRTVRADIAEMDALLDGIAATHARVAQLRRQLAPLEQAQHLVDLLVAQRNAPRARAGNGHAAVTAQALGEELRALLGALERGTGTALEQLDRELREVRDGAQQLRLVPAGSLFTALERTARDTARELGKQVAFETRGGEVRLDAAVLGAIQGALLQLVRNAVAHGIEAAPQRAGAGKPLEGRITLEVERRGQRVVFRCSDDGGGVDLEAVRRVAQRKGLAAAQLNALDARALLHLLLRGGISTSGVVTELAGRGIGLDVVRAAAEQVGGTVDVHTESGRGTRIELAVPLSLTSLAALLVSAADATLALPLDAVRGTLRLTPEAIARSAQGASILHEGGIIPFITLADACRHGERARENDRPCTAVIVAGTDGLAAIGVEQLRGTANVMLRPLPELAGAAPLVAGAAQDIEGNPQLVLDPDALVRHALHAGTPPVTVRAAPLPLLVIDDSLTTRMLEQSILESAGYSVDVVASGEEALEQTHRKRYGLFLVDIEMPGMDGFTFIERAHADPATRDVPAILVTSRSAIEDRRHGEQVGAQGYIAKSEFDQTEFLERIRQLVA